MTTTSPRFSRLTLRSTDPDAARPFYAALFGAAFWRDAVRVMPLPAQAAARGAPSHWLGHVGVADVDAIVQRFVAQDGMQLGPVQHVDGRRFVALRDPFGAALAVDGETNDGDHDGVAAWHLSTTPHDVAALAFYAETFGWWPVGTRALDRPDHVQRTFAWTAGGREVGGMASTVDTPHIHAQWLHVFAVADLDGALATVRAAGGLALPPVVADGRRFAACDDPQGAALGLVEAR